MNNVAAILMLFAGAIALPAAAAWFLFRRVGQFQRVLAALVGSQLLVVPIMWSIAAAEAGPDDPDPWTAVWVVALIALMFSGAIAWVLELAVKEKGE